MEKSQVSLDGKKHLPIGIFDSGLGGLTVLAAIHDLLPHEDLIYFGDTARVPYGSKSKETVIQYSKEILYFLLEKKVKAIVVACNTASAQAIKELRTITQVPIIGVIEPAINTLIKENPHEKKSAVIATKSTIRSQAYNNILFQKESDILLYTKACPLLVPLIEEGIIQSEITEKVIRLYINQINEENIEFMILGCTHYPLLKPVFQKLYSKIKLIDSSLAVAHELIATLEKENLQNENNHKGKISLYVSDITESLEDMTRLFFKHSINNIHKVNLGW